MSKYLVRMVSSAFTDYEVEAQNEKEAKNKVELEAKGIVFRSGIGKTTYRVLTPDFESEV
jgi:hypothetical protein